METEIETKKIIMVFMAVVVAILVITKKVYGARPSIIADGIRMVRKIDFKHKGCTNDISHRKTRPTFCFGKPFQFSERDTNVLAFLFVCCSRIFH